MASLDEILHLALEQILGDGAAEMVFACRHDELHISGLIDGTWHAVVPAPKSLLKPDGDLFDPVHRFFKRRGASFTIQSDPSRGGAAKHLTYRVEGETIRVIVRPSRDEVRG